jgi:hypothetical protein
MRILRGALAVATASALFAAAPAAGAQASTLDSGALSARAAATPEGTFYPLPPQRILDTRTGLGARPGPIAGGRAIALQVTGRAGVPASGVSAVVLNVTVTAPTRPSYLTVYPTGVPVRPTASSLNFPTGWTGANSVTVAVGAGGKVDIFNAQGGVQVVADVMGYYAAANFAGSIGGGYHPIAPERLVDTRESGGKLPAGWYLQAVADFGPEVNPHVTAVAVNITAVNPAKTGYLTAWNGDPYALPATSTLNYTARTVVPNMAIVPLGPCIDCGDAEGLPSIGVYTHADTDVLVDIVGVFDDSSYTDGLRFTPITPNRIVDSRTKLGMPGALGANRTATVTTPATIADPDTRALALNVTAVEPTAKTFLAVWPNGIARPTVSNLNPAAKQTVPNAVITELGANRDFNVYNSVGTTHVVVDVVGTFWGLPEAPSAAAARDTAKTGLPNPTPHTGTLRRPIG